MRIFHSRENEPQSDTPDWGEDHAPQSRGGFRWWAAVAFAGLVVVALVLVLVLGNGGDGDDSDAQAGGPSDHSGAGSSSARQGDEDRPKGCETDDADQEVPHSAPSGIEWKMQHGTATPTSDTAGPLLRDGAARYCYAHTPTGALLAAWNIPRGLSGDGDGVAQFDDLLQHSVIDNKPARQIRSLTASDQDDDPDADDSADETTEDQDDDNGMGDGWELNDEDKGWATKDLDDGDDDGQDSDSQSQDEDAGQPAGFKFVSYTRNVATITLVSQYAGHEGAYQAKTVTLRWKHGDWRYEYQPGPRAASEAYQVDDLSDFVPFSGVN